MELPVFAAVRSGSVGWGEPHLPSRVSGRRLPAPALGHEGVEFLAVLRALELLDKFGKDLRFLVAFPALLLEPLQFAAAILIKREVARGRVGWARRCDAVAQKTEILL